ncbi:hypothetical protein [Paenibacillus sp. BK720]|uniref:hypothetical protein n=1 Tax=Paenibacillus sp. BK720 TaxID=2587092 RepID=UPI001422A3F1|nr:hypothetical protein [Paenibacillus sp. BK720]NIK69525.1 hypothetical protein [Paenibacillus sp. BK720]
MKKWIWTIAIILGFTYLFGMPAFAKENDPAVEFAKAITRNDYKKAQSCIDQDYVRIPEIPEHVSAQSYQLVPSPISGVQVLMVNLYDEKRKTERLAYIWELSVNYGRITQIRVLYEGFNPLAEEARLIREYQYKFKRHLLAPTELPFKKVTEFHGYIEEDSSIELLYRNDEINGFFKVKASPVTVDLDRFKFDKDDVYYTLKDGTKALYRVNYDLGYELRFQKNGMQYMLGIGNKKYLKVKYKPETLLKIANSMV